ncbi:hypothetical protein RhiJN_02299 [Ceratobasidium sp. AG-Ba]|nr:hypothetical protein RhiJN_02299 [Ceratobasidium sp. AG-Ba]QRW03230.1 hypothetical protein RhiLY_02229 [Ceratobasidium sp. AG-Ba]
MHLSIPSAFSICLGLFATTAFAETVVTLAGPLRFVTTDSTKLPIKPTGNITVYYADFNASPTGNLGLSVQKSAPAFEFTLWIGTLFSYWHPDGTPGNLPYSMLPPVPNTSPQLRESPLYGGPYGLLDGKFLGVDETQEGIWWLCTDNKDKVPVLIYKASATRGCKSTYVALLA